MKINTIETWHEVLASKSVDGLDKLLADDVVFYSPVVHTPQCGKEITKLYLTAAQHVLGNETFKYLREVISDTDAVLEFETELDGIIVNGIDMISWNEQGQISSFKVMVRPLKAVHQIHKMMGDMLKAFENQQ